MCQHFRQSRNTGSNTRTQITPKLPSPLPPSPPLPYLPPTPASEVLWEEIRTKQDLSYISICSSRILYNSKFILMVMTLGTNAVVVTRVHCICSRNHWTLYNISKLNKDTDQSTQMRRAIWVHLCTGLFLYDTVQIITKTHLFKYIENFTTKKNENFQIKNSYILHISDQNIDRGYSLEPPPRGGSNEYPQSMFLAEIRKIMYTPVNPSFTI